MPARNIVKQYVPHAYYHLYNRGVEKRKIFLDQDDFSVFLALLRRHLDAEPHKDKSGREYVRYDIELLAFCLMPNHFHLFIHQGEDPEALTKLMRSVATAYTMYFNRKYSRVGHLFQERFKASWITNDAYLQHISRYIHLNPSDYKRYEWSSLPYYLGKRKAEWVRPERILGTFDSVRDYLEFVEDYEGQKSILDELKHELASL